MTNAKANALSGMRVLLVEDQSLIALDTEMMLRELGAATVDTFNSAEQALVWLSAAALDVAVLDVNLGTTSSFPIAEALKGRPIPFVFTTGYGDSVMVPAEFSNVPVVPKPYTLESLSQALALCLG